MKNFPYCSEARSDRRLPLIAAALLVCLAAFGCDPDITFDEKARDALETYDPDSAEPDAGSDGGQEPLPALDHSAWHGIVTSHVHGECFDYGRLAMSSEGLSLLSLYLDQLARVEIEAERSEAARAALWVNAYNALTVAGVIEAQADNPEFSVSENEFSFFKERRHVVAGRVLSLDFIEHAILRKEETHGSMEAAPEDIRAFAQEEWTRLGDFDARTHFALNCASRSCPNLRGEAYRGATFESQLQEQTELFLDDAERGAGPDGISSLFSWFEGDFTQDGSVDDFIEEHRVGGLEGVTTGTALPYDWSLNDFSADEARCRE